MTIRLGQKLNKHLQNTKKPALRWFFSIEL